MSSSGFIQQRHHACAVAPIHDRSSDARKFPAGRGTVAIIVLFSTLRLTSAFAQAPQLRDTYLKLDASTFATGWWSVQKAGPRMAPHLQLSMIEQTNIETSGLSHTFRAQETRTRQTDVCENQITLAAGNHATMERVGCTILSDFYAPNQRSEVNVRGYDPSVNEPRVQVSLYSQAGQSGSFLGDHRSSPLGLLLYPLETTPWLLEQHIAGTGFLTDEKGVPIYPFMEANLAGRHFSISLYIPPLRGSLRTSR